MKPTEQLFAVQILLLLGLVWVVADFHYSETETFFFRRMKWRLGLYCNLGLAYLDLGRAYVRGYFRLGCAYVRAYLRLGLAYCYLGLAHCLNWLYRCSVILLRFIIHNRRSNRFR